jgi:subtilisin-like proprotein convertase family protein
MLLVTAAALLAYILHHMQAATPSSSSGATIQSNGAATTLNSPIICRVYDAAQPRNSSSGVLTSTIYVPQSLDVYSVTLTVALNHSCIGALQVCIQQNVKARLVLLLPAVNAITWCGNTY